MLAKVSARFNPIAAFYKNRRKAFEMAARGDSEFVFEGMTPLDYVKKGGAWERIRSTGEGRKLLGSRRFRETAREGVGPSPRHNLPDSSIRYAKEGGDIAALFGLSLLASTQTRRRGPYAGRSMPPWE